jgi:hypothetical protein
MALEKFFGQIVDIARQITRSSAPPPPLVETAAAPVVAEPEDEAPVPSDDEVLVTHAGDRSLLVSWQLSERGVARARKIAAPSGEIEARLFVVTRDRDSGSKTIVRERTVGRAGEWLTADLPHGALVVASVGLLSQSTFVSVAHSEAVSVP